MKTVYYELFHTYGEDTETTDEVETFLGVFSSAKKAREGIDFFRGQDEFSKFPKKSFVVYKVKIDRCGWQEGFHTVREFFEMKYQEQGKEEES